jgi:mannitol/fructose-specific phosphotransferase system IIA component (Ntr-type)
VASLFGYPVVDIPAASTASAEDAVKFLVEQLAHSGHVQSTDVDGVCRQVLLRESRGSTAIGAGVALPHSKSDAVGQVSGVVGRAANPIPWDGSPDTKPVQLVCLLVTPASDPGSFLRAYTDLSRRVRGG